jgi:hypothetical protein
MNTFLAHVVVHMGRYSDREKYQSRDFERFIGFWPHKVWKSDFMVCCLSVCMYLYLYAMYICMNILLASSWALGHILFIFSIQEFVDVIVVPVESDHSSYTIKNPSNGLQNLKRRFSGKRLKRFWLNFSRLWRPSL